jgi:NTE family protein
MSKKTEIVTAAMATEPKFLLRVSEVLLPIDSQPNCLYNYLMQNLEPDKLIEASVLFRSLQPEETAHILACLQPATFDKGTYILESGIWHGFLYIIASGTVSVFLQEDTGNAARIAQLGPGECFGEMSLITGEPPSATISADVDISVWALQEADFLTLIKTCPTLLQNINTILSRRLARTNRQILSRGTAEKIWISFVHKPEAQIEQSLIVHIADALAVRSQKRVLVLEACGQDQSIGPRFATLPHQFRPSLLECSKDHSLLHAHRALHESGEGQYYPAFSALAPASEQISTLNAGILTSTLVDLAGRYDFLLLVTSPATPQAMIPDIAGHCTRTMVIVSADSIQQVVTELTPTMPAPTFFVAHVAERPTIGVQDRYTAELGRTVTRLLPAAPALLEQCWYQQATLQHVEGSAELTQAVDFVARHIAHQTVGIAFGGGGARGFAHLGVLEQLLRYNIPLDYIAACSSGIIAPGMYLIGKTIEESEEIFLEIQRHIVQWRLPRTSIFSSKGLKRMLREHCGDLRFEDLTRPFATVAVDLSIRAGVVLDRGLLWQAALASVSLPGIFPPVLVGDHILMDAGMHDPVPIRLVRKMGADILIASELGGQQPPALESATPWLEDASYKDIKSARSPHIIDLLLRTYDLAMATIGMHSIREADIVIRPRLHRVSLRQFSEGRKFVATGREGVDQALPELKKYLPWLT